MSNNQNFALILGGVLSIIASLIHVGIIVGGAEWYRFFGAGEELATMAEQGSLYPTIITFIIATVLFLWGIYAFSGAGLIRKLPFLNLALILISMIYLLRGIAVVPAYFIQPNIVDSFLVWSSLVCLIYGALYSIGTAKLRRESVS